MTRDGSNADYIFKHAPTLTHEDHMQKDCQWKKIISFFLIIAFSFSSAFGDCRNDYPKLGNRVCKMNDGSIIYIKHNNNSIIINNKYKAYTDGHDCFNDATVYKNKVYTYVFLDYGEHGDKNLFLVENIYGLSIKGDCEWQ